MSAKLSTASEVLAANLDKLMAAAKSPAKSQLGLAKKSGIAQATIGRILRGETHAGLDTIDAIAKVYGIAAWQLILPGLDPGNPQVIRSMSKEEEDLYARLHKAAQDLAKYER